MGLSRFNSRWVLRTMYAKRRRCSRDFSPREDDSTLTSVVPSDKTCCILMDLFYATDVPLGVGIPCWRAYIKLWSCEGFKWYSLNCGCTWMKWTSHCVEDTVVWLLEMFTVFTPSHVARKCDAYVEMRRNECEGFPVHGIFETRVFGRERTLHFETLKLTLKLYHCTYMFLNGPPFTTQRSMEETSTLQS